MKKFLSKKGIVVAVIALCVLVAGFLLAWQALKSDSEAGSKTIQTEIVIDGKAVNTYDISTDAEYLRQALEEQGLIQGDESAYGLFVKTVDGITADEANQEWWCFTKRGEQIMTGVDDTPIANGDHFEITLMLGYDTY